MNCYNSVQKFDNLIYNLLSRHPQLANIYFVCISIWRVNCISKFKYFPLHYLRSPPVLRLMIPSHERQMFKYPQKNSTTLLAWPNHFWINKSERAKYKRHANSKQKRFTVCTPQLVAQILFSPTHTVLFVDSNRVIPLSRLLTDRLLLLTLIDNHQFEVTHSPVIWLNPKATGEWECGGPSELWSLRVSN